MRCIHNSIIYINPLGNIVPLHCPFLYPWDSHLGSRSTVHHGVKSHSRLTTATSLRAVPSGLACHQDGVCCLYRYASVRAGAAELTSGLAAWSTILRWQKLLTTSSGPPAPGSGQAVASAFTVDAAERARTKVRAAAPVAAAGAARLLPAARLPMSAAALSDIDLPWGEGGPPAAARPLSAAVRTGLAAASLVSAAALLLLGNAGVRLTRAAPHLHRLHLHSDGSVRYLRGTGSVPLKLASDQRGGQVGRSRAGPGAERLEGLRRQFACRCARHLGKTPDAKAPDA